MRLQRETAKKCRRPEWRSSDDVLAVRPVIPMLKGLILSGLTGDDAKPYQERQVRQAIEQVKQRKQAISIINELCEVVDDVIQHFAAERWPLPPPRIRPMQEVCKTLQRP
jgi:hypothetical protein